jgi:hypothetical protein
VETVQWGGTKRDPHQKKVAVQKRIVTAPKPILKKSAANAAPPKKAKAKTAKVIVKKGGKSALWQFMLNPFIMAAWISLLITALAIFDRLFWKHSKREVEENSTVFEEKTDEDYPSWGQKLWNRIKEFFRQFRKKPVLSTC